MRERFSIEGRIADVVRGVIFPGRITVSDGKIESVVECDTAAQSFLLPGFVDAHVHVESSMLVPSEFARLAVIHGTVASVSDPHEIANVCGKAGVEYMLDNAKLVPFKFFFGAPSCVPATRFETAGAALTLEDVEALLDIPEILYLSEMMNWPGVLHGDSEVLAKIQAAKARNKPVDGHAPGLRGKLAADYAAAGISTDHECFSPEEALEKLKLGMKVLIREGSAARNFEALAPLLPEWSEWMMFCTDDAHPDFLLAGHVNKSVARAIRLGVEPMKVLRAATLNPVRHYRLPVGLLQPGDDADLIEVDSWEELNVLRTFIRGEKVAEAGESLLGRQAVSELNNFETNEIADGELEVSDCGGSLRAIRVLPGQLVTEESLRNVARGELANYASLELNKLMVKNRYAPSQPAIAFVENFGLKKGALAGTVGHDSHNVLAIGADDYSLQIAANAIIRSRGGLAYFDGAKVEVLALPIAGLMSEDDAFEVARRYSEFDEVAKARLGSTLPAPFMTLSFLALLVIPKLKLSDKGLFDGESFTFVESLF
jgi:adenine deaminase